MFETHGSQTFQPSRLLEVCPVVTSESGISRNARKLARTFDYKKNHKTSRNFTPFALLYELLARVERINNKNWTHKLSNPLASTHENLPMIKKHSNRNYYHLLWNYEYSWENTRRIWERSYLWGMFGGFRVSYLKSVELQEFIIVRRGERKCLRLRRLLFEVYTNGYGHGWIGELSPIGGKRAFISSSYPVWA